MKLYIEVFRKNLTKAIFKGIISKSELSRRTNISRPTIDSYLEGEIPHLDKVVSIAGALGITPMELIDPLYNLQVRAQKDE
jgi:transcriptional regulator with XRE-family HTH domain